MIIRACGASYKGNVRSHNEDNIYVDGEYRENLSVDVFLIESKNKSEPFIYAVFDGLGGEMYGENASLIAAKLLKNNSNSNKSKEFDIDRYLSMTDKAIIQQSSELGIRTMGTTAAIARIDNENADVYNIGDSRVYLFRDDELKQLSKDHSVVQSMIDLGFIEEEDRYKNLHAGELTQYLGMSSEEDIKPSSDHCRIKLKEKDILLLCSDGLNSELGNQKIEELLKRSNVMDPRYIATDLIITAKEGKCDDNVSVVIIKCM